MSSFFKVSREPVPNQLSHDCLWELF